MKQGYTINNLGTNRHPQTSANQVLFLNNDKGGVLSPTENKPKSRAPHDMII